MAKGGSQRTRGKATASGRGSARGGKPSSKQGGRPGSNAAAQRALRQARGARGRLVRVVLPFAAVLVIAVAVMVGVELSGNGGSNASDATADTSSAILASTASQSTGDTVDGVSSNENEQVLFHVHAHLAIYVNGTPKSLPYGVGIVGPYQLQQTADGPFVAGGSKYYWLHTHDESGIIHIESPQQRGFTLGNFFDIWRQPLSATQVGPATGAVTAFVNGQKFTGNPRNLPLSAHSVLQLDVGTVVPTQPYTFASGL
jgi:hypothetical protein